MLKWVNHVRKLKSPITIIRCDCNRHFFVNGCGTVHRLQSFCWKIKHTVYYWNEKAMLWNCILGGEASQNPAKSVAQWLKCSLFQRMVWDSIPRLATKWVSLVTLNMCGWDNMSLVAYSSLPRSLRINSNQPTNPYDCCQCCLSSTARPWDPSTAWVMVHCIYRKI